MPLGLPAEYRPRRSGDSVLHQVVRENLAAFLSAAEEAERPVPRFVVRAFEDILACGDPRRGFVRCVCDGCGHEELVPFACHRRAPCPSCGGRRMAEISAHLVQHVLPAVPVRQWVLSPPPPVRYLLAYDAALCSQVRSIFLRAVFAWLRRTAVQELGLASAEHAHCGSITATQRAGGAANLHPHWHSAVLDGVFVQSRPDEPPRFRALRAPTRAEQQQVGWEVCQEVTKLLQARGVFLDIEPGEDALSQEEPLLASCATGSLLNRRVLGPRAGQGVLALGMTPGGSARQVGAAPEEHAAAAAARRPAHGWDVHAGVRVQACERKQLERLLRYLLRPPLSEARLLRLPDGRVRLRLQRPWRNGTRFLVFEGIDFMARLVPLVPPPRVHQVVAHGVLAPRSRLRSQVAPAPLEEEAPTPPQQLPLPLSPAGARAGRRRYIPRAALMKRTLEIDPLACPRCGQQMRVGEAVTQPEKIRELLSARGTAGVSRQPPARAPPRAAQLVLPWSPTAAEVAAAEVAQVATA